ncbi:Acetyltransferase (GNAT) family [Aedoeadaptatus ivorii]|uniref:Acetyltransferase (GNAT) family n=1 Tax=Aedoeadaptatus ivorii TaxID=54006 RepID=A0A3S5C1Z2_9FIRM|nr:GNAT family N-acetyltransferase [Peptoniphilus ivorii]MDQ0508435.1 putative GNAT family acetyltransferase [Peptoniphilus ivorii]VEJ34163.1 Acetyltransferase (GNAT) family [Peptoniphilus ivorii]
MDIRFDESAHRAYALDGDKEIGESTYSPSEKYWIIDHTEVDKAYGGQGIAKKLVDAVVDAARERGTKIMATCPYALKLFQSSDAYDDVLYK